ncbi:restriction endonuclease subunit S [Treponema vincentii]|uniref:Restriction endonuclease subunit S n=1 Tax=Treponema vincentii TaxID=69710 RepID=A0A6P1Y2S2_9SPIR|nr:restriction endonuclease subunit S [Treponema vincentii]QHX43580.1 restriction endonuclease subunit S [Treponema vincentii]
MNTNALRQKILDLAIHGKLVKQDPADEPASVMLEKLRAEKEAKIAAGEIKRNKNDSYIFKYTGTSGKSKTDDNPEGLEHNRHYEKFADGRVKDIEDEIPFAVPEGWAWCRLGEIGVWRAGSTPNRKNIAFYKNGTIPWLLTGDLNDGIITDIPNKITEEAYCQTSLKLNPTNSICIAMYGATIGKLGILSTPTTTNQACCVCSDFKGISNKYLFYFLLQHREKFVLLGFGGAQPNISKEKIIATFIPLPPLSEQHRIVTAIEAIFAQIDILEQNKADLQTAVKQAKSKILDLAIHGKLVPQDPADEPASVMLERLRAEKEAKIAAGEMKRGKNDSYIYRKPTDNCYYEKFDGKSDVCIDNEIPFELPANWQWQRGKEIFCPMTTKIPSGHNFRYIDIDAIDNKTHRIRCSKLIEVSKAPSRASREVQNGDILFSLVRPYLKNIALVLENYSDCIASTGFYVCRPNKTLISKYAFYMMTSQYVVNGLNKFMKGDNSPSITGDNIIKWLYPLPPISEQKRIVTRIGEIFNVLDDIQRDLI